VQDLGVVTRSLFVPAWPKWEKYERQEKMDERISFSSAGKTYHPAVKQLKRKTSLIGRLTSLCSRPSSTPPKESP
jgi:hypothetical protein